MIVGALQCEALLTHRLPSKCPLGTASGCIARRLRRQHHAPHRNLSTDILSKQKQSDHIALSFDRLHEEVSQAIRPATTPSLPQEPWKLHRSLTTPWTFPVVGEGQDPKQEPDILRALRRGDPDVALQGLMKLSLPSASSANEKIVIQRIPRSTFHELLRLLDPDHALAPFKGLLRDMTPLWIKLANIPSIEGVMTRYTEAIDMLFQVRGKVDGNPSQFEYTFLLKCACALGDGHTADRIWKQMLENGIRPDLNGYNYLLGSLVGFGGFQADLRRTLSAGSYNLLHKTNNSDSFSERHDGGILSRITDIRHDMSKNGISPDQQTLCWILLGLSRAGDVAGISSLIREVWSINVDDTAKGSSHLQGLQSIAQSSPLYPSERLLYTVAEAYGSCNNIPAALRAIDMLSQAYKIQISEKVWDQLLSSAYILSRQNESKSSSAIKFPGKMSRSSVGKLWNTMIKPPYNIKPTMPMRSRHIKALMLLGMGDVARMEMEKGRLEAIESAKVVSQAEKKCLNALDMYPGDSLVPPSIPSLEQLRRELHIAQVTARRDKLMLYGWARLLFFGSHWRKPNHDVQARRHDWKYRQIPNIVAYWWEYLPHTIWYSTSTGQIAFNVDNAAFVRKQERGWEDMHEREEDGGPGFVEWSKLDSSNNKDESILSSHSDELDLSWLQDDDPFTSEDQ